MSRAGGTVRFPDGRFKHYLYNGTSDTVWPALFDTLDEAWDDYGETWPTEFDYTLAVPVEIYSDYGGGFWWPGRANERFILPPYDTFEIWEAGGSTDGWPPHWPRELDPGADY